MGSLTRAKELEEDANKARNEALAVKNDVDSVQKALKKADNASKQAQVARKQAEEDVDRAAKAIQKIKDTTGRIEAQMSNNKLRLNETSELAGKALAFANDARDTLAGEDDRFKEARMKLAKRKAETDRLNRLRSAANSLLNQVQKDSTQLTGLEAAYRDHEVVIQEKSEALDALIAEVNGLYEVIKGLEKFHRVCA